jgi:hypothetical protein
LSLAKTISPNLNDFGSVGPVAFFAPPPDPFAFFAPGTEARATFFFGSAATVEEGLVLDDAGLASDASAA